MSFDRRDFLAALPALFWTSENLTTGELALDDIWIGGQTMNPSGWHLKHPPEFK